MNLTLESAGATHIGLVREENEDVWLSDKELGLYLVSDGIGSGPEGALAAKMVAETLPRLLRQHPALSGSEQSHPSTDLAPVLAELNAVFLAALRTRPGLAGMGATVVAAHITDDHLHLGYLGDSHAYLLREGELKCLTEDHTLAETLLRANALSPEAAQEQRGHSPLLRFVGMSGEVLPGVLHLEMKDEDRLLLCSDGLWGRIEETTITQILRRVDTPQIACEELINAALQGGGQDNITVVALFLSSTEASDAHLLNVDIEEFPSRKEIE